MTDSLDRILNGYSELWTVGTGTSGRVAAALHKATGRRIALKFSSCYLPSDPAFAHHFRLWQELDCAQIVHLYEYIEADGVSVAVLELVDGPSLARLLQREPTIPAAAALTVLDDILTGLAAAHELGLLHGNLKPGNVLVDRDGHVRITDFAISPVGNAPYLAPEQRASPASTAADLYAAAAVLFTCLTGAGPQTGTSARPEAAPVSRVPEALLSLIQHGLAQNPAERPQSAAEFQAELRTAAISGYGAAWKNDGRATLRSEVTKLPAADHAPARGLLAAAKRHCIPITALTTAAAVLAALIPFLLPNQHSPGRPGQVQATGGTAAGKASAGHQVATSYSTVGQLAGVAAASPSSAWAVGSTGGPAQTVLMLHWNGAAWSRVTSPGVLTGTAGQLSAIAVVSATDAWAVGTTVSGGKNHTLILHWNGAAWSQVMAPAPVTGGDLSAVTATADSGWAVGYVNTNPDAPACCAGAPLIFSLNGSTWTRVTARLGDGAGLNGVAVTGPGTAWAIGMPAAMITGILYRWNGGTWTWAGSYPVAGEYQPLEGIAAGPGRTAFAVGNDNNLPGPPISMRWTGTAWQKVTVRVPAGSQLNTVAFAPGGTAWAAGTTVHGGITDTLVVRWSGTSWIRVASPTPGRGVTLSGLGFATSDYGWAVGSTTTASGDPETMILHWNGEAWS